MSLHGHYQNAYVTHDLDRAIEHSRIAFGLQDFSVLDVELISRTSSGDKESQLRVATAWAGVLQIELIQPVSGYIAPYADALSADRSDASLRLHHVAMRRDDLDAMRLEAANLGLPFAFESGGAGITCIFLDGRDRCGHFLEFVTATDAGWDLVGWPKGFAVG